MHHKNAYILMLEDDIDDRFIIKSFFEEEKINIDLAFTGSAQETISFLDHCNQTNLRLPSLILLD